jgi:CRP-like cAMP-binding protein
MAFSTISYARSDILQQLKKIFRLEIFDEKDIQRLLRFTEIRKYRRGQMITEEGKTSGYIYYLVSGRVQEEINENIIQVFSHTGAHFGERSIISVNQDETTVMAIDDSVFVAINFKQLECLEGTDSYLFKYIMFRKIAEDLSSKLKSTTDELIRSRKEISHLKKNINPAT